MVQYVNRERAAAIQAARVARLNCHKVHTMCLIASGRIRNKWLNDPLLHVSLVTILLAIVQAPHSRHLIGQVDIFNTAVSPKFICYDT